MSLVKKNMRNLITDIPGLLVGNVQDEKLASGVTALIFDTPFTASIAIHGGAPGVRDTALLEPEMTVEKIDALVLSGGSAFGLDSMGGVQAFLRAQGRGFAVGSVNVPIVPGAVLFDLLNGGNKDWGEAPIYWQLGKQAAEAATQDFALGTAGAGYGAALADLKGGLGSASAQTSAGFWVGALVAVNALGKATIGKGPHFWAAPFEQNQEFGGFGLPSPLPLEAHDFVIKGDSLENTTLAIVATDAALTKAQAKRLAVMANDGMALALRPSHGGLDGDTIFAVATGRAEKDLPNLRELTEIGYQASHCLARAIARGVYEAEGLGFAGERPAWREKFATPEASI